MTEDESTHAYSIIGVKSEPGVFNGKQVIHRFVIVSNPWGINKIRHYDKTTGRAYGTDDSGDSSHGIFKMELADFINTFHSYSVE